ncbi:MAG TPA: HupE/UreJ family protein [Candidatus Acidoferrum sp.]|jgi:hydrogenase/urease accessory protein HupE
MKRAEVSQKSRVAMLATLLLLLAICPAPAEAHLNSTGMGPIYDGFLHFLLSPEDIVPVVALALFAGLRGKAYGRRALFLLPACWFVGCLIGATATRTIAFPLPAVSFLVFGGLVTANVELSLRVTSLLAAIFGLFHGYLNGAGMRFTPVLFVAYLGLVTAIFILMALVSAFVIRLRPPWTHIAVRVAGSWIVASGLLMLGWAVRKN